LLGIRVAANRVYMHSLDHLGKAQIPGLRFAVDLFDGSATYVLCISARLLSTGTGQALEDLKRTWLL
jgi:hypothetical protein